MKNSLKIIFLIISVLIISVILIFLFILFIFNNKESRQYLFRSYSNYFKCKIAGKTVYQAAGYYCLDYCQGGESFEIKACTVPTTMEPCICRSGWKVDKCEKSKKYDNFYYKEIIEAFCSPYTLGCTYICND